MNTIYGYQCPDCKRFCMQGEIAHQHPDGEWVQTEDLRRFFQFERWRESLVTNSKPRILVVGDAMQDVYILGTAERLSPEAPIPVFKPTQEITLPGGAANVEANLKALGAETMLIEGGGMPQKIRYMVGDHQLLRVDERDTCEPIPAQWIEDAEGWAEAVVVSDYRKGSITPEVIDAVKMLCLPTFVDTKADPADWLPDNPFDPIIMFPNLREYNENKGIYDLFPTVVLKRGQDGVAGLNKGRIVEEYPSTARWVRSVNGAGDGLVAGVVYASMVKPRHENPIWFGNVMAGLAVEKPLTSTVTKEEVEARLAEVTSLAA